MLIIEIGQTIFYPEILNQLRNERAPELSAVDLFCQLDKVLSLLQNNAIFLLFTSATCPDFPCKPFIVICDEICMGDNVLVEFESKFEQSKGTNYKFRY